MMEIRSKNLAKLDAAFRRTTVLVSPVDQRLLRTKNVLKGKSWYLQAHGRCDSSSGSTRSCSETSEEASTCGQVLGAEEMTLEDFLGSWVDGDGNNIHVSRSPKGHLAVNISRPPLRQLRLELRRSEAGWTCGNATLGDCCKEQLLWRFPGAHVSTWLRQEALGDQKQAWLGIWDPENGYGPWGPASVTFKDVALMISNGMMDTMMVPEMQEDGTMLFVSLTPKKMSELMC
ncbi:unnamed protein product [Effrenium voratum]|nr:unnamed protein product [Effrenium voratum]